MNIEELRKEIESIDVQMAELFAARMDAAKKIAVYKREHGLPIEDREQERRVIENRSRKIDDAALRKYYVQFIQSAMDISKAWQRDLCVTIHPSRLSKPIKAPASKSLLHRLLICASLADGSSSIGGFGDSADIRSTEECLRALGAVIKKTSHDSISIEKGIDLEDDAPVILNCGESASTLRFLIPVIAASGREAIFTGSTRLFERPLSVYEDLFTERDLEFERHPLGSIRLKGRLSGGEFRLRGDISSQFISGLLFALPLLSEDSVIRLDTTPVSRPYIDMTLDALERFGIKAIWSNELTIEVPGGQTYHAFDAEAEGDWSNSAFLLAMGADVKGLDQESLQGDKVCADMFRELDEGYAEIDITDCPDLGPVLMAYAALRHGAILKGTDRLKYKESDRGLAMQEELGKFGVEVIVGDDTISIGSGVHAPSEELSSHGDHRIAMALTTLCMNTGGTIKGAGAVEKSWPDFFDRLRDAGAAIEENKKR